MSDDLHWQDDAAVPRYRSSAAARMVNIPVATLRVWERRYRVVGPSQAPSGHRLYSSQDVRRLGLIKQLVDQGNGIGMLARLDTARLQAMEAGKREPSSSPKATTSMAKAGALPRSRKPAQASIPSITPSGPSKLPALRTLAKGDAVFEVTDAEGGIDLVIEQRTEQQRLAQEGYPVKVLISYGEQWFPWYMRRLAERPANLWFVARSLFAH